MKAIPRLASAMIRMCWVTALSLTPLCRASDTNLISFTNRQGTVYRNVKVTKVDANGLVYLNEDGSGGGMAKLRDLPDDVLRKFGFDSTQVAQQDLDRAIIAGLFREVDGVVYDLRKKQDNWTSFQNTKLVNKL